MAMTILKEHNVETYRELEENLMENQTCALVQATGTGKSFIALQLISDYFPDVDKLILTPQNTIIENFMGYKENTFDKMHYLTYSALINKTEDELIDIAKSNALIVVDELHRAGAELWNRRINVIMHNLGEHTKVLGMTATPKRYLDKSRDMTEEIFNGNVVYGIDLPTAIAKGVLPGMDYVAALYRVEERVQEYREKLSSTKNDVSDVLAKFELTLENTEKVSDIIKKHTRNLSKNQKWIVFCESISQMYEIDSDLKLWFNDDISIYEIASNIPKNKNDESYNLFAVKKFGINIMKTVDMLNEGVHIEGITGVIMLRKTASPIIFFQQMGRALAAAGEAKNVIIFDLVGNHSSVKAVRSNGKVMDRIVREVREKSGKPNLCITKDYSIDTVELFEKIDRALNNTHKLTDEQKNDIVAAVNNGVATKDLAKKYDVSKEAINYTLRKNGITLGKSDDEIAKRNTELVELHLAGVSMKELLTKFDMSEIAIKIVIRNYQKEQGTLPRELYAKLKVDIVALWEEGVTTNVIAEKLGKPLNIIQRILWEYKKENGIPIRQSTVLTDSDKEQINQLLQKGKSYREIGALIPNLTMWVVKRYCANNGIDNNSRFFKSKQLRENIKALDVSTFTAQEIADKLGEKVTTIYKVLNELKLSAKQVGHIKYTEDEDLYIKERLRSDGLQTVAKHLGKTPSAIRQHATKLGIKF